MMAVAPEVSALERATQQVTNPAGKAVNTALARAIRFAQQGISKIFRHGEFTGKTVDEVAEGLANGVISPGQLPIKVIERDGITYALNNRSLMSFRLAGVEPTVIENVTGQEFFEKQLTERLLEIGKGIGDDFVPIIRGKPIQK
jgi:hypothetical protein